MVRHPGVSVSLDGLARARATRGPMTARHHSFTLTAPRDLPEPYGQIVPAITACVDAFLNPPVAHLGHRGIEKADTGGALFRNLYRDFLAECAEWLDSRHLRTGHTLYSEAACLWTDGHGGTDREGR